MIITKYSLFWHELYLNSSHKLNDTQDILRFDFGFDWLSQTHDFDSCFNSQVHSVEIVYIKWAASLRIS